MTHRRPLPATVLWRWRYEFIAVLAAAAGEYRVVTGRGAVPALVLTVGGSVAMAAVPVLRTFVVERCWAVLTTHRVRAACAAARLHAPYGRLPAVLRTRSRPWGQQVTLWCPAGVSVEDFRSVRTISRLVLSQKPSLVG